jgi:hypothetical protein
MRWPWSVRGSSGATGRSTTDDVVAQSHGVRQELIDTATRLDEYRRALQAEVTRLTLLADRVEDHGQR